jgi:Cu2+-exporting ATPase
MSHVHAQAHAPAHAPPDELILPVDDLYCVACAEELEKALRANPHIVSARVDFAAKTARVKVHPGMIDAEGVRALINDSARCSCGPAPTATAHLEHRAQMAPITLGAAHDRMQYELPSTSAHGAHEMAHADAASHAGMDHDMSDPRMAKAMERDMRNRFFVALVLAIPTVLYSPIAESFLHIDLPSGPLSKNWIMLITSTPVVWWAGWVFIGGAVRSLRHRALNMSVLIATGVLAAWGFSVVITIGDLGETFYEAAVMLVTFVLFGHWMEMKSRRGTTDALRALFDLVPPQANVIRDDIEVAVPTSEIVAGDIVVLRPGDKVPVDGVIESGDTAIDEALVTGESVPRDKHPGDEVIGGSINTTGSVRFRAMRIGADTALAQIVSLVEQAQSSKAPGQRIADRAAQYLVILAVGAGIVTFIAWYVFASETALLSLTFAISAIVIACPDALGLATPTAVAVGTGVGARHNILFKDAATLEGAARVDVIVLDKTGTLTEGRPALTAVVADGTDESTLLELAAAAEAGSEHPIATAVVEGARSRSLTTRTASSFKALSGKGLEATVDGRAVLVGNAGLMSEHGVSVDGLAQRAEDLAAAGNTPLFVAIDRRSGGIVAVADRIKPIARVAVQRMREAGAEPVMITGDNRRTADAVARELGIERVFAEVLPADKARYVSELQREGHVVAMVGDGINDAPALAQADVGIAIGAGTDVAIETARIVLIKSDPLDVVRAMRLSAATVTKMRQNLFWASIYNVLAIPIAAGVLYPRFGIELRPEWSALLMSISSIIVATNAVLLKRVDRELIAI